VGLKPVVNYLSKFFFVVMKTNKGEADGVVITPTTSKKAGNPDASHKKSNTVHV